MNEKREALNAKIRLCMMNRQEGKEETWRKRKRERNDTRGEGGGIQEIIAEYGSTTACTEYSRLRVNTHNLVFSGPSAMLLSI